MVVDFIFFQYRNSTEKSLKMSSKGSLLCYNRGCGKRFDLDENGDGMSSEKLL
jgi:hypothetical protein